MLAFPPAAGLIGASVSVPTPAGSFTSFGSTGDESNDTSYTFGSQTEGNLAYVFGRRSSTAAAALPSSVTTNGNTMSTLFDVGGASFQYNSIHTYASADGSSSGNFVVDWGANEQTRTRVYNVQLTGFDLSSMHDSASDLSVNETGAVTIDCPANGIVVAFAHDFTAITGLANTEASSTSLLVAWEIFTTAQTGLAVGATDSTTSNNQELIVMSFAPS